MPISCKNGEPSDNISVHVARTLCLEDALLDISPKAEVTLSVSMPGFQILPGISDSWEGVQFSEDYLGTPTWLLFLCLGSPSWPF